MRSNEIKGLTVFNVANGIGVGRVSDLLINAEKKAIDYLVVSNPNWYFGVNVIPFNMAEGVGIDAVVIMSESIMKKLNDEPMAISLIENEVKLIASRVLTRRGRLIGRVSEYYVDEMTGEVLGCELKDDDVVKGIIPANLILTFGRDIVIVDEKAEKNLLDNLDDYQPEPIVTVPPAEIKTEHEEPARSEVEKELTEDDVDTEPKASEPEVTPADKPKAVQLYEKKQREYLLGREVKSDIFNADGTLFIRKGDKITEEILEKAGSNGKLKEILLYV